MSPGSRPASRFKFGERGLDGTVHRCFCRLLAAVTSVSRQCHLRPSGQHEIDATKTRSAFSEHDRSDPSGPAIEDHGRAVTSSSLAAASYRQAQRANDRDRATIELRRAIEADPAFELARADLEAITGTSRKGHGRGQMNWERHHIEVVRTAASGDGKRAADLLREHLAGVGCDPLAFRIVAHDETAFGRGR